MLGNNILIGAAGAGGATGHIIEGSGLFDGSSGFLSRTPSSAGDERQGTVEFIVKPSEFADTMLIYQARGGGVGTAFWVYITSSYQIRVMCENDGGTAIINHITNSLFRDTSAYYHIVVNYDGDTTGNGCVNIYVNGTQITDFGTRVNLSSATDLNLMNPDKPVTIGFQTGAASYLDGYLARATYIDGLVLDPTSFGEVTSDGFWQINSASAPSWDYPIDSTTSIPAMTGNSAPSGYVASDNGGTTGEQPFEAFDGVLAQANRWQGGAPASNPYLQIKTPTALNVVRYTMMGRYSGSTEGSPTAFTLKASNSGAYNGEETVLDTQSSLSWSAGETKSFDVTNTASYTYHRVVITDTQGDSSQRATIVELKLIEPSDSKFGNNGFLIEGGANVSNGTDTQAGGTFAQQKTEFLTHFDGSDAATSSTDVSLAARTLTFNGNAQLDTAQKYFGTASLLLDGTGDSVSSADNPAYDIAALDFTMDAWIRLASDASGVIMSKWGASGQRGWLFNYDAGSSLLDWRTSTNGSNNANQVNETWNPSLNTWYHVAAERTGGKVNLYVDGTKLGSGDSNSDTVYANTAKFEVGSCENTGALTFNGHIDEPRFVLGVGLYGGSNFTPKTAAYTNPKTANPFTKTGTITATNDSPTNGDA